MPSGFAGFAFAERRSVGAFGETFTAAGPGGRRAQALLVDDKLGELKSFARTLLAEGEQLASVLHPNVIATLAVGREPGGRLVVITEAVERAVNLGDVLRDAKLGNKIMPAATALWVARRVARGLERAHRLGVVHGGVHPRSVWIDVAGEVRVGDFAVARALAAAAAEDDSLLRGLLGYVAPELALGDPPSPPSDVFGCAALLHELLTGSPPPGLIEGPPGLLEACEKALSTDAAYRQRECGRLADELDAAASQGMDGSHREMLHFLSLVRGAAERQLNAQTEDVLSSLIADLDAPRTPINIDHTPLPPPVPLGDTRVGTDAGRESRLSDALDALFGEGAGLDEPRLPLPAPADSGAANRFDTDYEPEDRAATFAAPQAPTVLERVSTANILSEEETMPDPRLVRDTRPDPAFLEETPSTDTIPVAAQPVSATFDAPAPARPKRASAPPPSSVRAPVQAPISAEPIDHRIRGTKTLWFMAVLAVGGAGYVVWKTGMLRPGDKAAAERAAVAKVADQEKAQKLAKARYADVVIDSDKPDAAVWMRLGRTPLDSLPLSTASIYELRVEQEGMKAADLVVPPTRWSGSGENMTAAVSVTLEPAPVGFVAPAAPSKAPPAETTGKAGRGRLHVESDPSGAEVWLLVGFTPSVRVTNLSAESDHDFKVLLDGHAPAFAQVTPAEFLDPTGALRTEVKRKVSLRARPRSPKK